MAMEGGSRESDAGEESIKKQETKQIQEEEKPKRIHSHDSNNSLIQFDLGYYAETDHEEEGGAKEEVEESVKKIGFNTDLFSGST